jgi:hypothetical protein
MGNTTTKTQVLRIDLETNEKELVSFEYALDKLSGYWDNGKVMGLLESGLELHTPYATYTMFTQ